MLQLEKEEREKQNELKAKVFFNRAILFCHSRHLVGLSGFRIDNRTIKRGSFNYNGYLVPLSMFLICKYLALSDVVSCMRKPIKNICEKLIEISNLFWNILVKLATWKGAENS